MLSMKDIATRLNISRCTVSNILNNKLEGKSYRKETIDLVRATAIEMGYVSNKLARSLKTGSTGTIAIVVPDIANTFYIGIIKEVEKRANECGYSLFICMAEEILKKENAAMTMLQSRCVDGVLISPVSHEKSLKGKYPFKIVCFDRKRSIKHTCKRV
jgi:LacI family transcriptional regulator